MNSDRTADAGSSLLADDETMSVEYAHLLRESRERAAALELANARLEAANA
jgi:hypothetical protein